MENKINQLELFKMFCADESEIRPVMWAPFEDDGTIVATDGIRLICCDKEHLQFTLNNTNKPLNISKVLPDINCNRVVVNKLEDFDVLKTKDELIKDGNDIACNECDGEGEVEWEYSYHTKTDECPFCDGSGYSFEAKLIPSGKKTFENISYLQMDEAFFDTKVFMLLFEAQKIIGEEMVSLNKGEKYKPALFKIGKYKVLIMPVTTSKEDIKQGITEISFKNY